MSGWSTAQESSIAPWSRAVAPGIGIFFAGAYGVYLYDGARVRNLSDNPADGRGIGVGWGTGGGVLGGMVAGFIQHWFEPK